MSKNTSLEGKRILLVDDEEDRLIMLTELFKIHQTELVTAKTGGDGVSLIREQSFDLIILDVMIGGMLGWSVYQRVKAADPDFDTPVLFLTSLGEDARSTFESLNPGPHCRLVGKDVALDELIQITKEMLGGE